MGQSANNQSAQIHAHLKAGKTITATEALNRFGTLRLAARIYDLKSAGANISKQMIDVDTRSGTSRVAQYYMEAS